MNLKITDYGPIESADISIDRINVVGGVNNSGKTTAAKLLYCYLKSGLYNQNLTELMENEGLPSAETVEFSGDIDISEIIFIEGISIMDLKDSAFLNLDHIIHITRALDRKGDFNSEMLSKIRNIIKDDCSSLSSAGIKQVGMMELLIQNNTLSKNSFLIIDEPESSLHPEWQIRFAQILVLLAKDLDIRLYLNSHSPMFIEAVSLYSQYYGLLDKTRFYLTQSRPNGRFTFKRINPKNMGEVYENLTRPYDELDRLKAKIIFRE